MSKPHPVPLKHHKCLKEKIKNFLETKLFERSKSPYTAPITVVPTESKLGAPIA